MKKYTIKCRKWNTGATSIMAEPWFADELFDALCDYYGIDSDDIERGYVPGVVGEDVFADGIGYENTGDEHMVEFITITMED